MTCSLCLCACAPIVYSFLKFYLFSLSLASFSLHSYVLYELHTNDERNQKKIDQLSIDARYIFSHTRARRGINEWIEYTAHDLVGFDIFGWSQSIVHCLRPCLELILFYDEITAYRYRSFQYYCYRFHHRIGMFVYHTIHNFHSEYSNENIFSWHFSFLMDFGFSSALRRTSEKLTIAVVHRTSQTIAWFGIVKVWFIAGIAYL